MDWLDKKITAKGVAKGAVKGAVKGAEAAKRGAKKVQEIRAEAQSDAAAYMPLLATLSQAAQRIKSQGYSGDYSTAAVSGIKITYRHGSENIRIKVGSNQSKMSGVLAALRSIQLNVLPTGDGQGFIVKVDDIP